MHSEGGEDTLGAHVHLRTVPFRRGILRRTFTSTLTSWTGARLGMRPWTQCLSPSPSSTHKAVSARVCSVLSPLSFSYTLAHLFCSYSYAYVPVLVGAATRVFAPFSAYTCAHARVFLRANLCGGASTCVWFAALHAGTIKVGEVGTVFRLLGYV